MPAFSSTLARYMVSRLPRDLQDKIAPLAGTCLYLSAQRANVMALMARADIFLLPTRADTYALAAVAAKSYGGAVVSSDLEPLREVVPDQKVGFVPAGDAAALDSRLEILMTKPGLVRSFQASARRHSKTHHPLAVVARRLGEVFEEVVSKPFLAGRE